MEKTIIIAWRNQLLAVLPLASLLLLPLTGCSHALLPFGEPQPLSRLVDYEPTWAPDGQSLAFVSNRNGYFKIYRMSVSGGELKQLTDGDAEDDAPAWSPDGSRIAYVSKRDGNEELYVMRADGSQQTRLTRHPGMDIHPAWSPDGRHIL